MGYPYVPLDANNTQIRTLTIEPSETHDSKIHCSINTVSLSSDIAEYEALSYVWGASKGTVPVTIDGHQSQVTRNLRTALRYLRKPREPRTLWVDAVCINQNDVQERNVQVRRMGQIYSQASGVLIWLGDGDADVERTMAKLQAPDALEDKRYDNFPQDIAHGIKKLLHKPWWHRVWTIQELILSTADPLVGCGHTWLEWEKLYKAILDYTTTMMDGKEGMIMDENSSWVTTSHDLNRHILLRTQWKEREHLDRRRATASEIVERTRGYQCTDKRDQIYGVRDLICDEEKAFFSHPDYEKSVSEVYQQAMVAMFTSKKNLTFLIHAVQSGEDRDQKLPSWCADFSQRIWDSGTYGNINGFPVDGNEDEEAHRQTDLFFSHDPGARSLKVRASFLGNIIAARPLIPQVAWNQHGVVAAMTCPDEIALLPREEAGKLWVFTNFVKEVLRMSAIAFKVWQNRFGSEKAKQKLADGEVWKIAFGGHLLFTIVDAACARAGVEQVTGDDRPYEYWNVESFIRESCPWYAKTLQDMGLYQPGHDWPRSEVLKRALWETLLVVVQMNYDSWWSATDSGYITRASRRVRENDVLCEISGCRKPMLLRPRDDGAFELVCLAESEESHQDHYRTHLEETAATEIILK
ncbi:hypothetical protein M409DRAFT_25649 [Zasmidium cellare ATCC 36951]|uniref:Heterokaryon incompatibility domain-containing protein n=1 Tax=Zasmidium cellare ATCC 36951 TaxID=1080233 RepID=A0A6A6CAP7_ZASCE|nr:uncharacterized protein M409DRAFT_25649 [Zasmidium cellare ATCC 36951]KAF2163873.1 hypothetical protein M409DRAFT_25649 [Zasmidium cellare ATCC 36951]